MIDNYSMKIIWLIQANMRNISDFNAKQPDKYPSAYTQTGLGPD